MTFLSVIINTQRKEYIMEHNATLECVTLEEVVDYSCHTDCGPFWSDDD